MPVTVRGCLNLFLFILCLLYNFLLSPGDAMTIRETVTDTKRRGTLGMSRRIFLYLSAVAGSVDDGLRPEGDVVGVALEELAVGHAE
jgi:hypothetical protein